MSRESKKALWGGFVERKLLARRGTGHYDLKGEANVKNNRGMGDQGSQSRDDMHNWQKNRQKVWHNNKNFGAQLGDTRSNNFLDNLPCGQAIKKDVVNLFPTRMAVTDHQICGYTRIIRAEKKRK